MRFVVRHVAPGSASVLQEPSSGESAAHVRARFERAGHAVLSVRRAAVAGARVARFDAAWWCRELRTLLRAGMTVVEAIDTLAASAAGAGERAPVLGRLLKALGEGQSLSHAMQAQGDAFPAVLVASVRASERTSGLVDALDDYLRYDELLAGLRRRAVSAAIYPALVAALGALITLFLLLFVVPRFSRIYGELHGDLGLATRAVLLASHALNEHLAWLAGALAALTGLAAWWLRGSTPAAVALRLAESIGPLRRQLDHFRFAKLYQSLALMIRGGYTLDEALQLAQGLDLGVHSAAAVAAARRGIAAGRLPSAAFDAAGLTDPISRRLLAAGERAGSFDRVLQTIADRHAQAFATLVERATRIVEPLLLLVVALVVGGVVVMMYLPIFDIAGSIGA